MIEIFKKLLNDIGFQNRHSKTETAFTRKRKLTFVLMVMLILQKTVKSLQLRLNEFFEKLKVKFLTASAGAFSRARAKLAYSAFIELNQKAIVEPVYAEASYKVYKGFRLLAVDSLRIILPNEQEIITGFGTFEIKNQHETTPREYPVSMSSVMHDVLNHIAIDSIMGDSKGYDVNLLLEHLDTLEKKGLRLYNELLILDRGYPSYFLFVTLLHSHYDFVARCSKGSFKAAQLLFENGPESQIVTLRPPSGEMRRIRELGLPCEIRVRLVRIVLASGEIEVLATSLLDETQYPIACFSEIYSLRWTIETFFDVVKNRLNLENFSGKTVESVKQDFFSTILITSLESVLTADAQEELSSRSSDNRQPSTVNKAVSFNTIKNHVIDLFYQENDLDLLLEKLTQLFLTKPISVQKHRQRPHHKLSCRRVLNFYKRIKKICF